MRPRLVGRTTLLAAVAAALLATSTLVTPAPRQAPLRDRWSVDERAVLASMQLAHAVERPADPSNAYERSPGAAALGRALFEDPRFSRDGRVACASCHVAGREFQDDRPVGEGQSRGRRRTMPVMGASHAPFLFWDWRKDSLWSQALGPLEDAAEHGSNRLRIVGDALAVYGQAYAAVFGTDATSALAAASAPAPWRGAMPRDASPLGNAAERAAWQALPAVARDSVNRVFANVGKAIAAYERQLAYGESRFDHYVRATLAGEGGGQAVLTPQEVRGLRLFLGRGQCATCHNGPLFTDQMFHNTGVPPADPRAPDLGRAAGVQALLADEFNCLGRYSDAAPEQCGELRFIAADDAALLGAFRTPGLRNVALRAPYMHAGQFGTLEQVVAHYVAAPAAAVGHSELSRPGHAHAERQPVQLAPQEVQDLVAFLGALSGGVRQPR